MLPLRFILRDARLGTIGLALKQLQNGLPSFRCVIAADNIRYLDAWPVPVRSLVAKEDSNWTIDVFVMSPVTSWARDWQFRFLVLLVYQVVTSQSGGTKLLPRCAWCTPWRYLQNGEMSVQKRDDLEVKEPFALQRTVDLQDFMLA